MGGIARFPDAVRGQRLAVTPLLIPGTGFGLGFGFGFFFSKNGLVRNNR